MSTSYTVDLVKPRARGAEVLPSCFQAAPIKIKRAVSLETFVNLIPFTIQVFEQLRLTRKYP